MFSMQNYSLECDVKTHDESCGIELAHFVPKKKKEKGMHHVNDGHIIHLH